MKKLLLIIFIASIFYSCSNDQDNTITPPPPVATDTAQGSLQITVKDTVGFKGLDGVKITIYPENRIAYTENGGFVIIDSLNLGQHRITVEKQDYNSVDTTISILDSIGMNFGAFNLHVLVSNWNYYIGQRYYNQGKGMNVFRNGSIICSQNGIGTTGNYIYKSGENNWAPILNNEGSCYIDENPYSNCTILTTYREPDNQGGWISTPDLHVSYDNGNSWTNKITNFEIVSVAFCQGGIIYAVGRYGNAFSDDWRCYKSTDNGNSWNQSNPLNGVRYYYTNTLANNRIIIGNHGYLNGDTVYISDNSGNSWSPRPVSDQEALLYRACKVLPNGNLISRFYDNGYSLKMSNNNGDSWFTVTTNPSNIINDSTSDIAIASNGYLYISNRSFTSHDIFVSPDNGSNWTSIGQGLPINRRPFSIGIDSDGFLYTLVGSENGSYTDRKIYKSKFVFPH